MVRYNHSLVDSGAKSTSVDLVRGCVYTRDDLKAAYGIVDATINNGVFRPRGKSSIWLFVTEVKPADRTAYRDRLVGNTLGWQGQTSGRTDALIKDHQTNGDEIVVFYRKHKSEHPGYGFRYEGNFTYVTSTGSSPTSFILTRN